MREDALRKAARVVPRVKARLEALIESVRSGLPPGPAEQLHKAAARPRHSMDQLASLLEDGRVESSAVPPTYRAPEINRPTATRLVRELDDVIREIEDEILNPLEDALSDEEELRRVKRQIGSVWGEIIGSLQGPLWKQYPDLAPK